MHLRRYQILYEIRKDSVRAASYKKRITKKRKMNLIKRKFESLIRCTGQATLEFVMVMPFVIIVILAASQAGLIVYNKMILQQASRECARIISTTNSNSMAREVVNRNTGENIIVSIEPEDPALRDLGDMVTVRILKHSGGIFKIISDITGKEFMLKAEANMRMECD